MATAALVGLPIDEGARLIRALDGAGLDVPVAFWIYTSEWGEWRLALASPYVDQHGSREMYRRIQAVMKQLPDFPLRLDQTWAVGLKNPTVRAIRSAVRTGPGMSGMRLTNNLFDGVLIEDAYLYRSA